MDGRTEYELEWTGYTMEENTWEPVENLQCVIDMVNELRATKQLEPLPGENILVSWL